MLTLGIDCGTSALKAVLVEDGAVVAAASESYRPDNPRPGWSEQDPNVWRGAMGKALAALREAEPKRFAGVKAVSFSGQMHGLLALDSANEPLRPAMLHNDTRAADEARLLWEDHRGLADVVGVKPMPGFLGPKALWLAKHEPDILADAKTLALPKDFLRLQFCAERVTDMSDAAGTWWLDEARREWSEAAIAACGAAPRLAPRLVEARDAVGRIGAQVAAEFGLSNEVIIGAGGGDAPVGAVGLGAIWPGQAFISLGTASQLVVISDVYRAAPASLVHSFAHAVPNAWYRMGAMLTGASALAFAARLFEVSVQTLEREAATAKGDGGPLFLPYLTGERTPHDDANARGVFFGLDPATSRADCARAVMEGVAFTLADAKAALAGAGDHFTQVSLIGGGAKSRFWARLIASALGVAVVLHKGGETGPALGAARLAEAAAGGDLQAVCVAPPVAEVIEPEAELSARLGERYVRFGALYQALKGEFARSSLPPLRGKVAGEA